MSPLDIKLVHDFVIEGIRNYQQNKQQRLSELKLNSVLKRKNPYLFCAKVLDARDFISFILDAHLSSQEETLFGEFLEQLAIYVNGMVFGGRKSSAEGVDLEFSKKETNYLVAIKSGPNWGNSSQINRMVDCFLKATRILRTNRPGANIIWVNGCCYGLTGQSAYKKQGYYKFCGQTFWSFISGNDAFYTELVEPLRENAKRQTEEWDEMYRNTVNRFLRAFLNEWCEENGEIKWRELIEFNSAGMAPPV